jgi:hypothetical protein
VSIQRYVSNELTHFVGGDLMKDAPEREREKREERLYRRLIAILEAGCLKTGGTKTGVNANPSTGKKGMTIRQVVTYKVGSTDLTAMFDPSVICFCDIPVGDVAIHMSKYSPFGLAFRREYLLKRGANPVLYVAEDAKVDEEDQTFGELFVEEMNRALRLLSELQLARQRPEMAPQLTGVEVPSTVSDDAMLAHQFLMIRVFSLVKAFRGDSADEDPENYYMEREWRRYGDLDFSLEDVCRVYLPERFAKRLRGDAPDYYGQVTFSS